MSLELEKLSALQLGSLVNHREISCEESIRYFADRIEARNPSLNAFTYTKIDEALEVARQKDASFNEKHYLGPLAGVPFALKDFLPSKKGWQNSHGGVPSLVAIDDTDSMCCKAAEELGAIAIGKTNAPAFGFSGACQNVMYGQTHNPFDISRTSGGSSGGSAAAVADGLVLLAESGDAGGSTRIPAGWCNCFGYKASLGTIPSYCRPDAWTATHPYCFNGCETKTVEDSAIMLNHMARYNPLDPISLPINSAKDFRILMNNSIKGKKIAFTFDFDLYQVDPNIKEIVYEAAQKFVDAGCTVDLVTFDFKHRLEEIMTCWCWSISVDTAIDLAIWKRQGLDLVKDHREELPEEFIQFNEMAANATIFDMREFNEIRTDILDNFENILAKYDVIISPIAACDPMKNEDNGHCKEINGIPVDPSVNFISFGLTPMVNFIGYPACSIPAGFSKNNCPIGMQIIGRQYRDEDVFAFARTFEKLQPWSYEKALNRM